MNQDAPRVLVPPRPNPGPEPWSEIRSPPLPFWATAVLLAVVLVGVWTIVRHRRARRTHVTAARRAINHDDSPSGKLLTLAEEVRGTLIAKFGPAMRARTTEEIAADPLVREALGEQRLDPLIRLLAEADRWKFATRPGNGREESLLSDLPGWEAWHRALLADTAARPKPRTRESSQAAENR